MLVSIETYRTYDFLGEGGSDPLSLSASAHAYDIPTCFFSRTVFLMQRFVFHCSATSDTTKHDEVHDSGYLIWFYIKQTETLNGISMC